VSRLLACSWLAIAVALGCTDSDADTETGTDTGTETDPTTPCPAGMHEDPPRAVRLARALAGLTVGRDLAPVLDEIGTRFCFGAIDRASLAHDGRLLLREAETDPESTARLAHLLHHVRAPLPALDGDPASCTARLTEARRLEEEARVIEVRARRELGLDPDAAPGVEAVLDAYASRCERRTD
jgi:hypothetical protein